jgi:hypothetical protein
VTCSRCSTEYTERVIVFGDGRTTVKLCECRAAKLTTRYMNTRSYGAPAESIGLFDQKKQRRRKTA